VPLAILPDAAGVLALGRVAIHTGNERLSQKCTQIARATLAVDTADTFRHLVWLLALQAMARGDATAARSEVVALRGDAEMSVLPLLARDVSGESELVRLALAAHDDPLAESALRDAEERARLNPGVASSAAAAAHCRGLLHDDANELSAAAVLLDRGPRPLLLASALEDLGSALVKHGRTDEGINALGRALELYASAAATWDSRRVRGRLRRLGVRRRLITVERPEWGWEALTESELEVVRLIAHGLTNRETAERLYVSPHTIGAHLRRAFTKLDINSRVELTRIALEHDGGA
jgi:DNA-binding CsgD family transcriptional regulator